MKQKTNKSQQETRRKFTSRDELGSYILEIALELIVYIPRIVISLIKGLN